MVQDISTIEDMVQGISTVEDMVQGISIVEDMVQGCKNRPFFCSYIFLFILIRNKIISPFFGINVSSQVLTRKKRNNAQGNHVICIVLLLTMLPSGHLPCCTSSSRDVTLLESCTVST
jgi:hypothetical protein